MTDHRGRRGFAAGAADGDAVVFVQKISQHLGAFHNRNVQPAGFDDIGDRFFNGGGNDQNIGVFVNAAAVLREQADTLIFQNVEFWRVDIGVVRAIGSADIVSLVFQRQSQRAHAAAADAAEKVFFHGFPPKIETIGFFYM